MRNALILFLILSMMSCNFKSEQADLVIHNAVIYTVDDQFSTAAAVAVKNGKILAVGAEREIMNVFNAQETLDAQRGFLYPGFIDAHSHFIGYGKTLNRVNLVGTQSWDECLERIKAHRDKFPDQTWIQGRGWDQNDWEIKEFPTNNELNDQFPEIPVYIQRIDGHAAIANQKTLDLAGINIESEFQGGKVLKNESGQLTGVLIDNAMTEVDKIIPESTKNEIQDALIAAEKKCFEAGLTSVTDAGINAKEVEAIKEVHRSGKLKMRVYAMLNPKEESMEIMRSGKFQDDQLTICSVKLYSDGALGSRGAALKEPYSDDPHNHGLIMEDTAFYVEWAEACKHYGFQLNTHCIGDAGAELMLGIYKDYLQEPNDLRWRIEHAQVLDPADMHYFGDFSIIPSVQPTHATSDMYWAQDRLGEGRMQGAYAYKSLLQENGMIPLGTDFPVEDIDPLKTFYAAVFRRDGKGYPTDGFLPEEALTREEALKGMTIWAALAAFEESIKGSIEPGKLADFTILNVDLLNDSEEKILNANVLHTVVGGEVVYSF